MSDVSDGNATPKGEHVRSMLVTSASRADPLLSFAETTKLAAKPQPVAQSLRD